MPVHLPISIHIDKKEYKAPKAEMTGAELRNLRQPPAGNDLDLFLEVPGPSDDLQIADDQVVQLKEGMQFHTGPRTVTPGSANTSC